MAEFRFEIIKQDKNSRARAGVVHTRRGDIETPHFVPVGTLASVRSLDSADLEMLGAQCALVNTYHLHLKPGDELIKKLGGAHKFMNFSKPLFSDSGGFQAFSLGLAREHNIGKIGNFFPGEAEPAAGARLLPDLGTVEVKPQQDLPKGKNLTKISNKGIEFRSIYDGSRHFFDAKKSMEIQSNLNSDIIMAFDECTSPLSDYDYTKVAMERTHNWAKQSLKYHNKDQALYGIIQGGYFKDLRDISAKFINDLPFDGIAIGGSLGKTKADMHEIIDWVIPQLDARPAHSGEARPAAVGRPRHLLGIGEIDDIFESVEQGIDTFDCVAATRNARRGCLFLLPPNGEPRSKGGPESGGSLANKFRINISRSEFKEDSEPIDPACQCPICENYSRAYLRHLHEARELSYFRLATIHNLWFMLRLMEKIRESIKNETFIDLKKKWLRITND
ncbi:MAG: tRNA guanosine(34) transglycosylase Tgt [Minisyncoccales bacterium]